MYKAYFDGSKMRCQSHHHSSNIVGDFYTVIVTIRQDGIFPLLSNEFCKAKIMLILYGGFNDGELNVWKYEEKIILDKFLLRINIGGEIV